MRYQSKQNRTYGLNAGRERRIAAGNREEISAERRGSVYREDVEFQPEDYQIIAPKNVELVLKLHAEGIWLDEIARLTKNRKAMVQKIIREGVGK
jgi:hypothetical protein